MKHILTIILVFFITCLHAQKIEQIFDVTFKPTNGAGRYYVTTEQKEGHGDFYGVEGVRERFPTKATKNTKLDLARCNMVRVF